MTHVLNGVTPLNHLGIIRVEGEDAASFLQGQLTQDFGLLGLSEARLAAYCTPKGRMQASFIGFKRSHADILLVCSRDILPATQKRLSMFVLRAKAKLRDATAEFDLYGLAGAAALEAAPGVAVPWSRADIGTATAVRLYPADGQPRVLWVAPAGEAGPGGPQLEPGHWMWSDVRSGVATITAPIVEAFVPQMLNYESVGGVNFKKGCYPGQEVVARSQFRGTLKRRAHCRWARRFSTSPMRASPAGLSPSPLPHLAAAGTRSYRSRSRPPAAAGSMWAARAARRCRCNPLPTPCWLTSEVARARPRRQASRGSRQESA
ncbi:MAG: folate-binding protein YgfZ [Ramlibacter sp.]|nr:folate-binding protein YgfZ [Ramlibacter sp.]